MFNWFHVIIAAIALSFFSCNGDQSKLVWSEVVNASAAGQREDTILKKENGTTFFSRLYKPNSNGLISKWTIPDSIAEYDFKILFSGRARTNYAHSNASIMVAVMSKEKEANVWSPTFLRYYFTETNTWCDFKDSVTFIHESWQKPDYYVNVFAYLYNSEKENFDMENLKVQIFAKPK